MYTQSEERKGCYNFDLASWINLDKDVVFDGDEESINKFSRGFVLVMDKCSRDVLSNDATFDTLIREQRGFLRTSTLCLAVLSPASYLRGGSRSLP